MRLTKLTLEQFRNHSKLEVDFSAEQPVTYIVGENAQGKTNILEAIYLLALTKSFRTNKSEDLIGWGQDYARVKGVFDVEKTENQVSKLVEIAPHELESNTAKSTKSASQKIAATGLNLEIFLGHPPHQLKALKKNDVKISGTDFIGNCQVVFFHPEDLNMLYLGPDLRRRYLNVLNIQISKPYFKALRSYQRVLKQRNALLHAIKENRAQTRDLAIWDEQLIEHGSILMLHRAWVVEFFHQNLQEFYRQISEKQETVGMNYKNGAGLNTEIFHQLGVQQSDLLSIQLKPSENSLSHFRATYAKALTRALSQDVAARFTTIGPHRDDIEFTLNDLPLYRHASRGEYRSLILALKLLELKFYQDQSTQKPLLLLDDVFSELDEHRQSMLMQAIAEHQTIITTTHLDKLVLERQHAGLKKSRSFKLKAGILQKSS